MTGYGKTNLLGMFLMPLVAMLTAVIMFGLRFDTMLAVFIMNSIPMLIGGLFTGLLLRGCRKSGGGGRSIALWPTLLPAIIGISWYLRDALFPAANDPGRVYIAGPQYLLVLALITGIFAWVACMIARSRRAAA